MTKLTQDELDHLCDAGKMVYCVDIDGTLFSFPEMEPNSRLIQHLNNMYDRGHYIIIHTGRSKKYRDITITLLAKAQVPYNELIMDKPKAHIYVDDSTIDIDDYVENMEKYDRAFQKRGNEINKIIRKRGV